VRIERTVVVVAARDEAQRLGATLAALRRALPDAELWVADDRSRDATAAIGGAMGAHVVSSSRGRGKGAAVEAAVLAALASDASDVTSARTPAERTLIVLCDGDLAETAYDLRELAARAASRPGGLLVASFEQTRGGGFGLVRRIAAWAIAREREGAGPDAPLSGQRALRASELRNLLPLARGYGLEVGMTIDALRSGMSLVELPLALAHRARGRTPAGFAHRGRQLLHVARACVARTLLVRRVTSGLLGRRALR